MKNQDATQKFTKVYCSNLVTNDGAPYIKIPVVDYKNIEFLRGHLAYAIQAMAENVQADRNNDPEKKSIPAILALSELLQKIDLGSEMEGIDEILEEQKKTFDCFAAIDRQEAAAAKKTATNIFSKEVATV